jgi:hypothetical protein
METTAVNFWPSMSAMENPVAHPAGRDHQEIRLKIRLKLVAIIEFFV